MIVSIIPLENEYVKLIESRTGEKVCVYKNAEEAAEALAEAEITISWADFDEAALKKCKKLKWMFIMSAGVEKLPFIELDKRGIIVTNVSGIHGSQMAEQTFGMMIAFSRRLKACVINQTNKKWERFKSMDELTGKTLCIIGAGNIGREMARKAKAFDMKVLGLKKKVEEIENFDLVWGMDRLYEALGQADYSVLLTPLTDETYHLIGKKEFDAMKSGSIFINMSRGNVVDENALIEALRNGPISGAGLDVFSVEPLPGDSPLWDMENVVMTPHNAGQSPYYTSRSVDVFIESYACYRAAKPMPNRIDLKNKY